jgi:hypothetical protein
MRACKDPDCRLLTIRALNDDRGGGARPVPDARRLGASIAACIAAADLVIAASVALCLSLPDGDAPQS